MLRKECELEKSILQSNQILASLSPDHFALSKFGVRHFAKVVSEVIYVVKCTPVRVQLIQTDRCYNEVPVLKNNKTQMFLTHLKRILVKQGTEITCSTVRPPTFKINNEWLKFLPYPLPASQRFILKPDNKIT